MEKIKKLSEQIHDNAEFGNKVRKLLTSQGINALERYPDLKEPASIEVDYNGQHLTVGFVPEVGFFYEDIKLNNEDVFWYEPQKGQNDTEKEKTVTNKLLFEPEMNDILTEVCRIGMAAMILQFIHQEQKNNLKIKIELISSSKSLPFVVINQMKERILNILIERSIENMNKLSEMEPFSISPANK